MANEPMELAKNYTEKKQPFPALAQVKYDGVPIVFTKEGGKIVPYSRQNEVMKSVDHLCVFLWSQMQDASIPEGACVIAECFVPELPFKDSSGVIRRNANDARIVGVAFDGWLRAPNDAYNFRLAHIRKVLVKCQTNFSGTLAGIGAAPSVLVHNHSEAMHHWSLLKKAHGTKIEGMMLHDISKTFRPGKRCWGMGRYKPQPTIDLQVMSYEEAISEEGAPLGMVGRINVLLRRQGRPDSVVGIGPGKLSHDERKAVWRAADEADATDKGIARRVPVKDTFCEIKYMPDPEYDALRQPTFQQFRPDKKEGDILVYI